MLSKYVYQQALRDLPFPQVVIHPCPYEEYPPDVVDANECTFDPHQLIIETFGESALQAHNDLWGWGIIDLRIDGEDVRVVGMFNVAKKDDWTAERLYTEDRAFWGDYNPTTRQWSISFGH